MPPIDFSPSKSEKDEEFISPESLFAPDEEIPSEEEERKKEGGGLEERLEGEFRKRGEREIDKYFEERWGKPKIGRTPGPRGAGGRAVAETGEEIGGKAAARGAVGAGERAIGGAGARAAARGAAVRAGAGAIARGAAAGAAEGAAAGSAVPGVGTAIGAVVMTVLSLPKSFAEGFKGEYSRIEFVEFTVFAVGCFFLDIFFIVFGFLIPLAFPLKMTIFMLIAFWITKYKGSVKPWGMLRLVGKIVSAVLAMIPTLFIFFVIEGILHNKEGRDTIFKDSSQTKKGKKEEKKSGAQNNSPERSAGTPRGAVSQGARAGGVRR